MNLDPVLRRLAQPVGDTSIEAWSVFVSEACGVSLSVKDGLGGSAHTPAKLSAGTGLHYKLVWADGRLSRGRLERMEYETPAALDLSLQRARASAFDDPDACDVAGPTEFPDPELFSDTTATYAEGEAQPLYERMEQVAERVRQSGAKNWSGSAWARRGSAQLHTSRGLHIEGRGTRCGWSAWLDGRLGDGYDGRRLDDADAFENRFAMLARRSQAAAREAATDTALEQIVLLQPSVVERMVLGTLFAALGGASVTHGEGAFRIDDFSSGKPVTREDLSLSFDPTRDDRVGSYRFTSEGIPAAPTSLIDEGRLVQPILSLKYARKLALPATPFPQDVDTVSFVLGKPLHESEAFEAATGGVQIFSVLGLHTLDGSSGDYSLSAPHALALDKSGPVGRRSCTLSGNLYEALRDPRTRTVTIPGEPIPGLLIHAHVQ